MSYSKTFATKYAAKKALAQIESLLLINVKQRDGLLTGAHGWAKIQGLTVTAHTSNTFKAPDLAALLA